MAVFSYPHLMKADPMTKRYNVKLDLYRGASERPYGVRTVQVPAASALDACCQAENALNVRLGDVEYAAACEVFPVWETRIRASALAA